MIDCCVCMYVCKSVRHDKSSEEGNGVGGGAVAVEPGDEEPLHHLLRRRLHDAQLPEEARRHHEHQHRYQKLQLPHLFFFKKNSSINFHAVPQSEKKKLNNVHTICHLSTWQSIQLANFIYYSIFIIVSLSASYANACDTKQKQLTKNNLYPVFLEAKKQ